VSAAGKQLRSLSIAIVGAGPGGLCTAIRLRQAGFERFVILEKAEGLGGTWYHNRYPGCACDIPSHLYSFSFEPKCDWSRPYALAGRDPRLPRALRGEVRSAAHTAASAAAFASARWDETARAGRSGSRSGEASKPTSS
jgi:cation diffusion facilitator CzcD-associated flavoprotein CzcO